MSYSQRLLELGNPLTRLAHRSRFSAVLDVLGNAKYTQALDYGCGDGWLLRTAFDRGIITSGIGVDVADYMLSASQEIFAGISGFQFCKPGEISQKISQKSCDVIFCTETLEHIGNPEGALEQILIYCQPGAKIVISVPIEVGPSLLFKQIGRYLANLKGNYGYESYNLKELFEAVILWDTNSFISSHSMKSEYTGHKGFDYRKIEKLLQEKVKIERRIFSPFPWSGNLLNSTVIWVCNVENS
ncbi:class I SAM-dependent methyltransferase [Argonema galeatum]|uniref:class I SAM-dependent methyltransferase n=1 Tax=Argonema galeatum TaxID=2942762 RepID=UPI002010D572|nr:class I SAM-dependent methyltransferase [Argonema galeatum]MCL1468527.1 class I SAM-dependent methyltransferase [Argonema galeatum A003/A1]